MSGIYIEVHLTLAATLRDSFCYYLFIVVITNKKIEKHRDEEWREEKQSQGQNWWSCRLWK